MVLSIPYTLKEKFKLFVAHLILPEPEASEF